MQTKKIVLHTLVKSRAEGYVNGNLHRDFSPFIEKQVEQKCNQMAKRGAEIVKCSAKGYIDHISNEYEETTVYYHVEVESLVKQRSFFYIEETVEKRKALFYKDTLLKDEEIYPFSTSFDSEEMDRYDFDEDEDRSFNYDRRAAVQYAERYWNSHNPSYTNFDVNCTNYVSQCLRAGTAPMRGYPNKGQGWWMQTKNWSYSWTVANSFYWYLNSSKTGLTATKKTGAKDLMIGDIICYDFQGDGRWDHSTIIVAKDDDGMPLVNANTYNSRMRYWAYEDSSAYTPNMKYGFFHING
ncbi:amidase domain-containing protein [Priestia koreensis]|uniref:amidase domain-containing protein n=1 Tax=Priestia koreensis TaxID=284581 RepID=UPI001F577B9C|nr:amidase domain-containing protein [Priestia koreensis]MCM3007042.1 amidase domain-containing protein [Priestia koreensis]UNL85470.1 amidase domain-containing protein [Priestia koreensis]